MSATGVTHMLFHAVAQAIRFLANVSEDNLDLVMILLGWYLAKLVILHRKLKGQI
jgi:hypothetical protein